MESKSSVSSKLIREKLNELEKQKIKLKAELEEQEKLRAGKKNGIQVFNKSKQRLRPKLGVDIEVK